MTAECRPPPDTSWLSDDLIRRQREWQESLRKLRTLPNSWEQWREMLATPPEDAK